MRFRIRPCPVFLLLALALPVDAQQVNRWRPGFGVFAGVSAPAGSLGNIEGVEGNATAGAIAGLTGSLTTPRWEFIISADRTFGSAFVADICDEGNCGREEIEANLLTVLFEIGYRPVAVNNLVLLGGIGIRHRLDAAAVNCVCRALESFANPADQLVWRGGARLEKEIHRRLMIWGDGSVDFTSFRPALPEPGDRYNLYADVRITAGMKVIRSRTAPTPPVSTRPAQ